MKYPKYLYRKSDGWRFTLKNGFYSLDKETIRPRYEYAADLMMGNKEFFVDDLSKCDVKEKI